MKKFVALLLCLVLLCSASALAENLTDKPINFAEFTFGQTLQQVRSSVWVESLSFSKRILPTRMIGDINRDWSGILYEDTSDTVRISARLPEREIAGHRGSVELHFTFPGASRADNDAVLYAGIYSFYENAAGTFEDLKTKLTKLYGEPWKLATSSDEIWGPMEFSENDEWRKNEWTNARQRMQNTQYVVWKSSANGGMMVLKYFNEEGSWERSELCYLWPEADQYLDAMYQQNAGGASANDMQGL